MYKNNPMEKQKQKHKQRQHPDMIYNSLPYLSL